MTKEEAEAYMDELVSNDLDDEALAKVAGGSSSDCWWHCDNENTCYSVLH